MDNVQSSRSNQRLLPLRHRAADRKRLALRFNPCNLSELRLQAKRNLRPLARQNCCNVAGSFIPLCLRVYDVRIRGETHHNEAAPRVRRRFVPVGRRSRRTARACDRSPLNNAHAADNGASRQLCRAHELRTCSKQDGNGKRVTPQHYGRFRHASRLDHDRQGSRAGAPVSEHPRARPHHRKR